ncbi:LLM class flavin-dependent oxidoreductase [Streptomyces sp. NPDC051665]|uniref:LLM class flavin-dependent oxidoreductase n=1 Tax=Streptomyces sp. NPDC051665 TaxID=3154647 RepID=UPI0034178EE8
MGRRARLYADHRLRAPRLAEELAVLDDISREEFAVFDVPMKERAKRVTEVVATLKSAFTGEQFSYRGRAVRVTPAPYRPGDPAVLLGGSSEPAARRAARIADGFVIGVGTVGEDAVLEVADEGPGLSPAQTAHIFERGEFAVGGVSVNGASGPGSRGSGASAGTGTGVGRMRSSHQDRPRTVASRTKGSKPERSARTCVRLS